MTAYHQKCVQCSRDSQLSISVHLMQEQWTPYCDDNTEKTGVQRPINGCKAVYSVKQPYYQRVWNVRLMLKSTWARISPRNRRRSTRQSKFIVLVSLPFCHMSMTEMSRLQHCSNGNLSPGNRWFVAHNASKPIMDYIALLLRLTLARFLGRKLLQQLVPERTGQLQHVYMM